MSSIISSTTLKTTADFSRVYNKGRYAHTPYFVLYHLPSKVTRHGVVASKKVGNAVKRNRAKRRLRALLLDILTSDQTGTFVLVAKQAIHEETHTTLQTALLQSLSKVIPKNNQTKAS